MRGIDPRGEWLFYVEDGRRKLRGRWWLIGAGMLHLLGWCVVVGGGSWI